MENATDGVWECMDDGTGRNVMYIHSKTLEVSLLLACFVHYFYVILIVALCGTENSFRTGWICSRKSL
jgi:hypothetical protein